MGFRALGFGFADVEAEARPFAEGKVDEVVDAGEGVGDEVDSPETRVGVGGREGHEGVGEFVLVDEGRQFGAEVWRVTHRAIPVADDGLGDESGEVIVVFPAHALDCECDVGGGHGVISYPDLGADEVRFRVDAALLGSRFEGVGVVGGHGGEVFLCEIDHLLVRDAAGADEDHAVGSVVCLDVVD